MNTTSATTMSKQFSILREKVLTAFKKFPFSKKKDVVQETEKATPGCILSGTKFKVGEILGEGGFGKVFKAAKGGKQYALKICTDATDEEKRYNRKEAAVLADIAKSNATEFLLCTMKTFSNGPYFVYVTEELGISLYEEVVMRESGPLQPQRIKAIIEQVLLGTNALLKIGYVHHDIKLDNILLCKGSDRNVKLVDFGLSHPLEDIANIPYGGTLSYCAPEEILGYPCTEKIDTWSIGCVFFALFTGFEMFSVATEEEYAQLFLELFNNIPKELEKSDYFKLYFVKNSESGQVSLKEQNSDIQLGWKPADARGFNGLIEFGYCHQLQGECSASDTILEAILIHFIESFLKPVPSRRPNPQTALLGWNKVFRNLN